MFNNLKLVTYVNKKIIKTNIYHVYIKIKHKN